MTADNIIRMAREAGAVTGKPAPGAPEIIFPQCMDVEHFHALAVAAERERIETSRPPGCRAAIERARQEERDACRQQRGVWMFNPYSGDPRRPSDIASDPHGILLLDPEQAIRAKGDA